MRTKAQQRSKRNKRNNKSSKGVLREMKPKQNWKEQQKREHQPHGGMCCCYAHLSTEATTLKYDKTHIERMVRVHAKPNERRAFSNAFFGPNEFADGCCLETFQPMRTIVPAAIANNDFLMNAHFSFSIPFDENQFYRM